MINEYNRKLSIWGKKILRNIFVQYTIPKSTRNIK